MQQRVRLQARAAAAWHEQRWCPGSLPLPPPHLGSPAGCTLGAAGGLACGRALGRHTSALLPGGGPSDGRSNCRCAKLQVAPKAHCPLRWSLRPGKGRLGAQNTVGVGPPREKGAMLLAAGSTSTAAADTAAAPARARPTAPPPARLQGAGVPHAWQASCTCRLRPHLQLLRGKRGIGAGTQLGARRSVAWQGASKPPRRAGQLACMQAGPLLCSSMQHAGRPTAPLTHHSPSQPTTRGWLRSSDRRAGAGGAAAAAACCLPAAAAVWRGL